MSLPTESSIRSTLLSKNMLKDLSRQPNHTTRLSDKAVIVADEALISTWSSEENKPVFATVNLVAQPHSK